MNNNIIERINEAIKDSEDKTFNLYFFIADCKNTPNSNML